MKKKEFHKINTIKESIHENKIQPPLSVNEQESESNQIENRQSRLKSNPKVVLRHDSKTPITNSMHKASFNKENFLSTQNNLMNKNLEDNKSIYSTSKKGDNSAYKKFNNNSKSGFPNNEKSAFGDSFDAGKASLKEIMEKVNKEAKIFIVIDECIDYLNGDKFFISNSKEEKDKYEMIEKNKYTKMTENNIEYKQKKIQLTEDYNKMVKHINQVSKEIINLKSTYNEQEKSKEDLKNNIYYQQNEIKEIHIKNEKIREMIIDNRMKKNNTVKALVQVCKKHQEKIPKNKKKLFETFYNKQLEDFVQMSNLEKIKNLKDKIAKLEEEVKIKNKELDNVKNLLSKN